MNNLKEHTGVESIFFATQGSMDLPLRGVSYATHGVENFLEGALKMDKQDFIRKMEGFSIQGLSGKPSLLPAASCKLRIVIRCCKQSFAVGFCTSWRNPLVDT